MTPKFFLKAALLLLMSARASEAYGASVVISDASRAASGTANVFNRTNGAQQIATPSMQSFVEGSFSASLAPHSQIPNAVADGTVMQNSSISTTATSFSISGSASGSGSLSLTPPASTSLEGVGGGASNLNTSFTLTERFSFTLNVTTSAANDGVTQVRLRGGPDSVVYVFGSAEEATGGNISGILEPGDYTFLATLNARVELGSNSSAVSGTQNAAWTIDFQGQQIPEPCSFTLLAASGLFLASRRIRQ